MSIDPTLISNLILITTAFFAAFIIALWVSIIFWTARDSQRRIRDPLVHILSILLVVILFLPGVIIYLILRPQNSLESEYQNTLEEEALLQAIELNKACPICGRETNDKWVFCPFCHSKIKQTCQKCDQLLELQWKICPFCGDPVPDSLQIDVDYNNTDSV